MPLPKSKAEWAQRTRSYLKKRREDADVTYGELAKRLEKLGFEETEASIANKLKRGTFSATFFLAALTALTRKTIRIEDI